MLTMLLVQARTGLADSVVHEIQSGQTFKDCPDCPEMVVIPPGNFLMGSSTLDRAVRLLRLRTVRPHAKRYCLSDVIL
jgi:formylglycine-generating enzyme required for sulfatase activity